MTSRGLLSLLPVRGVAHQRLLDIEYLPIVDQGVLARVLVIASDGTDRVARERSEARQKEMLRVFRCLMTDADGFVDAFTELRHLVQSIIAGIDDVVTIKRHIHTVKGGCGFLGLTSLANYCHELEDKMAEAPERSPSDIEISGLNLLWTLLLSDIEGLVGGQTSGKIRIEIEEFNEILRVVQGNGTHGEIAAMIRSWQLEPVGLPLNRLAMKARALSESLGKPDLEVVVEAPHDLRLDPLRWRSFWSALVHVLRNAVDHGIETPEERAAVGKRANGRLTLATSIADGRFVVEIADDGRGIDWARIAAKAKQAGLPCESAEDLSNAIFSDGVTSRDSVSELSGRAVGLPAVRSACLALGGRIQLDSTLGDHTRFRFVFPVPTLTS